MNCGLLLKAMRDKRLTRTDLSILGALIRIDGPAPSRKEVAEAAGCAPSSVPRSARKLEELGYVERVIDARDHGGRAKPTGYRLKQDTYQDGCVSDLARTETEPLDVVVEDPERSPDAPAHTEPDTRQIPPKDNNQTPWEFYPERLEASGNSSGAALKILNGHAATTPSPTLAKILFEVVNSHWLDPIKSPDLNTSHQRIRAWIAAGADFDTLIVPTIKAICERPRSEPIGSLIYFDKPMAAAIAKQKRTEEALIIPKDENIHDLTSRASDTADVRRERVSPATAARHRRRAEREAQRDPIDFGRVESERIV